MFTHYVNRAAGRRRTSDAGYSIGHGLMGGQAAGNDWQKAPARDNGGADFFMLTAAALE